MMKMLKTALVLSALAAINGCQSMNPIETVPQVDLHRFMGKWYVIANIPTFLEKNAYNPVETYRLSEDGSIATTFTFNKGGFDDPLKSYTPRAFVQDRSSNALWGMQFIWPIKAEYRIIYLNDTYTQTVIGRSKRDYVWIMARTPRIPLQDYDHIISFIESQGYDISRVQQAPHENPGSVSVGNPAANPPETTSTVK